MNARKKRRKEASSSEGDMDGKSCNDDSKATSTECSADSASLTFPRGASLKRAASGAHDERQASVERTPGMPARGEVFVQQADPATQPQDWMPPLNLPELDFSAFEGVMSADALDIDARPAMLPSAAVPQVQQAGLLPSVATQGHSSTALNRHTGATWTLDAALDMVSGALLSQMAMFDATEAAVNRLSMKIFSAHPAQLPASLRSVLQATLADVSTLAYLNARPGCVHLTVDVLLSEEEAGKLAAMGPSGVLQVALAAGDKFFPASTFEGPKGRVVAQVGDQAAVATSAGIVQQIQLERSPGLLPQPVTLVPLAMVPGCKDSIVLLGESISGDEDVVVCRRGSATPDLEVLQTGACANLVLPEGGATWEGSLVGDGLRGGEYVEVRVPRLEEGLHCLEVQRGSLLSPALPFLVLREAAAVAELRQLETDTAGVLDVPAFVQSMGFVLDFLRQQGTAGSDGEAKLAGDDPTAVSELASRVAPLAARLAMVCAARGWPTLLGMLLPAVTQDAAAAHFAGTCDGGATLLHAIAASRCAVSLQAVQAWSEAVGFVWQCSGAGPGRVTPLHIAVLLDDGLAMATGLTALYPEGAAAWHAACAAGRESAASLAKAVGNSAALGWLYAQPGGTAPMAEKASGASGRGKPAALAGQLGAKRLNTARNRRAGVTEWPYRSLGHPNLVLASPPSTFWASTYVHVALLAATLLVAVAVRAVS